MIEPLAHAGHWAVNLLYVAPLLLAVGVLGYQAMKDRRAAKSDPAAHARRPPTEPPPA
ncbi:MAG: hypothetical protein M3376_00045 [Actinomycetota bacterium]|nr:hypothetical protein [Actinomycetota bacterium]